jgi:hypothetical protein
VVLERLDEVEVGALALGEAVLTVELELGGHNGVLTPAVKVKGRLGEDESTGIRHTRVGDTRETKVGLRVGAVSTVPESVGHITGTSVVEDTISVDESLRAGGNTGGTTESVDGVGEGVNGIRVVEGLGTKNAEEVRTTLEGRAVINAVILLDNPHKLLNGVVEVELDLVGRGTDGLITSELELLNQVLMGVLSHLATLISVQEHVINVERGGNQRLVVGGGNLEGTGAGVEGRHSPQALVDGTDVEVDLDLVVLEGDQGQGKTGVTAEPELEGHVEGGLGKGVARSAHLTRGVGVARTINVRERGVGDVGKLGGVANHLVVATLLILGEGKLVPDVHPVTILTVNALTTNLNLNLRDELLTGEVQPAGINGTTSVLHLLVDLGQGHLKVGAVGKITIARDGASHTATEISLTVEGLLDGLHSEVSVATVSHLPESDLRLASQVNVLGAISNKLH